MILLTSSATNAGIVCERTSPPGLLGKLRPIVDRTYPLAETAEGARHAEQGHARGKAVVTMV